MVSLAILMIAVISILTPLVDRMQKRRNDEWRERKRKLMKIDDDEDDDARDTSNARTQANPISGTSPSKSLETNNPYQPPVQSCDKPIRQSRMD